MKANELRIGNLVYDNERIYQIYSGTEIGNKHNDNNFKPIPLTEEWLVKFGIGVEKGDKIKHIKGMYGIHFEMKKSSFHILPDIKHIKYVHQLQNLYFALTGEEL